MKNSVKIVATFCLLLSFSFQIAHAAELASKFIPTKPILRPEGIQQMGATCHAAAFLSALEHHFQKIGKPVRLSLLHFLYSLRLIIDKSRHLNTEALVYSDVFFDEQSTDFLEKHGSVLPYYMHPEEHRMTSPHFTAPNRGAQHLIPPRLANVPAEYKSGWPIIRTHILSHNLPGFDMFLGKDKDPIRVLKETILNGKPAIFSFSNPSFALFADPSFSKGTLLERKVLNVPEEHIITREISKTVWDKFYQELVEYSHDGDDGHALALVGFDDTLYKNYGYNTSGGFILKGTWDDTSFEYISIPYQVVLDLVSLNKKRAYDVINNNKEGGASTFVLRLQYLELPQGFEENIFQLYEKYKDEEDYQVLFYPFFLHISLAREVINKFTAMVTKETNIVDLSFEQEINIRKMIASLFLPWSSNLLINVGIFSGFSNLISFIQDQELTEYYKYKPDTVLFPTAAYVNLIQEKGESFAFMSKSPDDLNFWKGFFVAAKTVQDYFDVESSKDEL